MRLCVVGGGLQGLEASYLSKKLGWKVILIDKKLNPPAKKLSDKFYNINLLNEENCLREIIENSDAILPATENVEVLKKLRKSSEKYNIPFLQDNEAFFKSRDKKETEKIFDRIQIPHPRSFDLNCKNFDFPIILKPSFKSGSRDVTLVRNMKQLKEALNKLSTIYGDNIIIQKYINGLALSLEVIGDSNSYTPILTTCLEFDTQFSCKRVYTPEYLDKSVESQYINYSVEIARDLGLRGLMDTQAILDGSTPLMLEVNARLPSQTPTVVYHSTGINFIKILYKILALNKSPEIRVAKRRYVIYQHVEIKDRNLFVKGERIIKDAKELKLKSNFFGAEAITNLNKSCYSESEDSIEGVATIIVKSRSLKKAQIKMSEVIRKIKEKFDLEGIIDESPSIIEEGV